jgi:hypothetical protein
MSATVTPPETTTAAAAAAAPAAADEAQPTKVTDKGRCRNIFLNLLLNLDSADMLSSAKIRGFYETVRCDHVFNLAEERADLRAFLTRDGDFARISRLAAYEESDKDERIAAQATSHYYYWHHERLQKALPWTSWVWYRSIHRAEKTLAMVGLAGTFYGAGRASSASFRYLRGQAAARQAEKATAGMRTAQSNQAKQPPPEA